MAFLRTILVYVPLILGIPVTFSEARRERTFQEKGTYCGPRLTQQLHDFCELFYGPSDLGPRDWIDRDLVVEKCCEAPCSILHIVLAYCKKPKNDQIRKTFGKEEYEYYKSLVLNMSNSTIEALNTTSTPVGLSVTERSAKMIRRKKHIRKRRRRRKCRCPYNQMDIEKKNKLMSRAVPEHSIGIADYPENELMIIVT